MASGQIVRGDHGGIAAPEEPCQRCGVRADVGCRHRPAAGVVPLAIAMGDEPNHDGRSRPNSGQGFNFHRQKQANSLWGKADNPTRREFASNLEAALRSLRPVARDD